MVVKSVFQIKGEHYTVVGYGQEATSAIMKQFPLKRIIFMGFMMGEDFQPF